VRRTVEGGKILSDLESCVGGELVDETRTEGEERETRDEGRAEGHRGDEETGPADGAATAGCLSFPKVQAVEEPTQRRRWSPWQAWEGEETRSTRSSQRQWQPGSE
jgi:hypothetical protein